MPQLIFEIQKPSVKMQQYKGHHFYIHLSGIKRPQNAGETLKKSVCLLSLHYIKDYEYVTTGNGFDKTVMHTAGFNNRFTKTRDYERSGSMYHVVYLNGKNGGFDTKAFVLFAHPLKKDLIRPHMLPKGCKDDSHLIAVSFERNDPPFTVVRRSEYINLLKVMESLINEHFIGATQQSFEKFPKSEKIVYPL